MWTCANFLKGLAVRRPRRRETTRGRVGLNVSHGVPQASVRRRDACERYGPPLHFLTGLPLTLTDRVFCAEATRKDSTLETSAE